MKEQGFKSWVQLVDGLDKKYADYHKDAGTFSIVEKESIDNIINHMDLTDSEIQTRTINLFPVLVESILDWDENESMKIASNIKSYIQASIHKSQGFTKDDLIEQKSRL
jgi:hypothetical protein|tara:strand:- start:26 stop:352 length:327 start_codon:yes stop_codon:yes gene_type:complete